ncbi:Adenomatous polyposis coli [Gossypium arboreum]|uniref:Adenomatous polyposis coli n=1 Tax=Gossypium arboreum TaxID=29729 RepID=A0A0B0N630_GOSAR|nr:Adenomatous polyposis coli [Gossypium arboreum]
MGICGKMLGNMEMKPISISKGTSKVALKSSIEMENTNYEEELKNDRRLVCNLIYEINCRKEKLPQMEREYNEMITTLRGLINGLIAKINSKDSNLWGWELQYNVTVRQLKGKNAALCRAFAEWKGI